MQMSRDSLITITITIIYSNNTLSSSRCARHVQEKSETICTSLSIQRKCIMSGQM